MTEYTAIQPRHGLDGPKQIQLKQPVEALQLTWATWSQVCEFVPEDQFIRGTYLSEDGTPIEDGSLNRLGMRLRSPAGTEHIACEGDWLLKHPDGCVAVCSDEQFVSRFEEVAA